MDIMEIWGFLFWKDWVLFDDGPQIEVQDLSEAVEACNKQKAWTDSPKPQHYIWKLVINRKHELTHPSHSIIYGSFWHLSVISVPIN